MTNCLSRIKVRSGRYLDLIDPQPSQFQFSDIAGGLAKLCRFSGQTERFYTVAEHCCNCAIVSRRRGDNPNVTLAVLMHDAAEAFIGDVTRPLKEMLSDYRVIEQKLERVIAEKFSIDFGAAADRIHEIDRDVLMAERRQLFPPDNELWCGESEANQVFIKCRGWLPIEAELQFTRLACELGIWSFV